MFTHPREDPNAAGYLLAGQARYPGESCRADEAENRFRQGARDDYTPLCDGGTGVWQPARQQASAPFHVARKKQSGWAVEVVLHDA